MVPLLYRTMLLISNSCLKNTLFYSLRSIPRLYSHQMSAVNLLARRQSTHQVFVTRQLPNSNVTTLALVLILQNSELIDLETIVHYRKNNTPDWPDLILSSHNDTGASIERF